MEKDIRDTALYREAETLYRAVRRPGAGLISDASEISTNGVHAVFSGTLIDSLSGVPPTRICITELATGDTRVLTFGPNIDRSPRFSPDGRRVAFLSDRHKSGDFQLYLLDPATGAARPAPHVEGWVEYLHWSPDGQRILLGVAGHGADVSGGQGAISSKRVDGPSPSWMPAVDVGSELYQWRRVWVYELESDQVRQVSQPGCNVWEAGWCGNTAVAAVVSPGPGEGLWYSAALHLIDVATGADRVLYTPERQLGWPAGSPSGRRLAFVEAICSDRWIVAGDLRLLDVASGHVRRIDTGGLDVTWTEWRSERTLLIAGHRGFETAVAVCDADSGLVTEVWRSTEISTGGRFITISGIDSGADCVMVGENFKRSPEIALIRNGQYRAVRSFDVGYAEQAQAIEAVERVTWCAPDGLVIQGWLLRPAGKPPHPLVMNIHGGPVWMWRSIWLGRGSTIFNLMLVRRGYAVFFPNPRGSAGRGQAYSGGVLGDMGGADTHDYLSGLDHLIAQGVADPKRLGVTGASYGGFMTSWLISQDERFSAAVSVAPVTNQVTEHLISNIPHFVSMFLADSYHNQGGKYFQRSPIMHAHKVKTPTLNVCGALDRCTPPEEALQFHHALLENGTKSVLVTYPEEGHGVRKLPAAIDYVARVVGWFEEHMPCD